MRIAIIDTYYPRFLKAYYQCNKTLNGSEYEIQHRSLLDACFGTSDYYSHNLLPLGCEALDLIVNCVPLQKKWAIENNIPYPEWVSRIPSRVSRLPIIKQWISSLPNLLDVAVAQIRAFKADVIYCHDLSFFSTNILRELRPDVRLIVGQIASPLPSEFSPKNYDLVLTSFPHYVDRLRASGVASELFRLGFDERILKLLGNVPKDISSSFVGGISLHHGNALPLLEHLVETTDIRLFGYGATELPKSSPICARHGGEVWGLDMYRTLARSRITLNRHIGVAENFANNMRLYEATGVGALLLTDRKDNLSKLFEIDREVVAYSSKDEAAELIKYYSEHQNEAGRIAQAGQARTLREHTYANRMQELVEILRRYLK